MRPTFDERDEEIRQARIEIWRTVQGPRVGDYVLRKTGELHRITVDLYDDVMQASECGSYYFAGPHMSFSGGCGPLIKRSSLELTAEERDGACWFFHHGHVEAHNGVRTTVPCRVYREV